MAMTDLTSRQLQVAQLVRDGWTDKQIAAELQISKQRVSRLIASIAQRLDIDSSRDARTLIAKSA